jgi:hypothetical protein
MTSAEKKELKWLTCWLTGVCVPYMLMPKFYPPRTLTTMDYNFMAMILLGAVVSVRPGVSRRWLVYYGVLGAIPFVLDLEHKLGVRYQIRPDVFEPGILHGVYVPGLLLFVKLVAATAVLGLIARRAKTKYEEYQRAPHET